MFTADTLGRNFASLEDDKVNAEFTRNPKENLEEIYLYKDLRISDSSL